MANFGDLVDSRLRRSVIDPETGAPVVTSAPTGEVRQRAGLLPIGRDDDGALVPAVPQGLFDAIDAARFPGQVARGERGVFDPATGHVSDEAIGAANGIAGLAMTGSLPFSAPKGAVRSFGGAAAEHADEPFVALEAALNAHLKDAAPARPQTFVDPKAPAWDLYHGTSAAQPFERFEVNRPREAGVTKAAQSEAGALFLSPAADEAAHYAGDIATKSPAPRIFRTTVEPGKTDLFDIPRLVQEDPAFVERMRRTYLADEGDTALTRGLFDNHIATTRAALAEHEANREVARGMGYTDYPSPDVPYAYGAAGAAVQAAKERGLDTAILRGLGESNGGDQVVALTPGRVRSFYAPDQLLYSGGPAGAVPAALAAPGDARAEAAQKPNTGAKMAGLFDDVPDAPAAPGKSGAAARGGLFDDIPTAAQSPVAGAPASGLAGDGAAAVGRGIVNGVPVVGPYLLGGLNRAAAAVRTLQNGTTFPEELKRVEAFGEATAKENPGATIGGEIVGGIAGTAPLVAAAPAAFGAGAGRLAARAGASALSGGALGAADSAVRSEGDARATGIGAGLGVGLGVAGPMVGAGIGRVVGALSSKGRTNGLVQEALEGVSDKDLAAAQHLIEQSRALPGGGVPLTLDEALNAVTDGQATRASQLARVVGNSGGEGGRIMGDFYAARPARVDNVGKAAFDGIAPPNPKPTDVGFDVQEAARAGLAQTPEGQVLGRVRAAQAERITPEQAGQLIQSDLAGVRDLREAARSSRANVDYRLAREAPENVGIERTVTVERPGEPVVTYPEGRPQFGDAAPRPFEMPRFEAIQGEGGGESLARFVARNGGLDLNGDARAADLQRFNIPGLGTVARPGGKSIDNFWREHLIEHGYLKPDADGGAARDVTNELLRLLQNEQRAGQAGARFPIHAERSAGRTASAQADEFQNAYQTWGGRLDEDLTRAGIDPVSLHPDIRSRAMGALMRGEENDPLAAVERTVNAMREPPAPYVRSTVVEEQVPDVRFGQVDPRPAVAAIAEQGRSAKGDVRGALGSTGRDLREPGGDLDMSVEGLLKARERLDFRIRQAQEIGDGTKVRDLTITRSALDDQLKRVPEVATADANFARNSASLAPFERPNAPLNRITARVDQPGGQPGPFRTPAEQVPEALTGPTALREALANGGATTREAAERRLLTQILDGVTDPKGNVSAEALRASMREHAEVLDQMPALRDRLSALVQAREGMVRIEASPLGRIAKRPDVKTAIEALFPADPLANSQAEIGSAVTALARNNPRAARDMVRIYMEGVFNEATQEVRGVARQYGGAGFASAVRGNGQQRHNLEAAIRALPEGETLWTSLDRMMTALEATGYRPQKGSDTAFNQALQARLKQGAGTVGQAVSEVVSGAAAGATVGGPKGALGGAVVGLRRGGREVLQERRVRKDSEAVARILTDPKAIPMLRSLANQEPGSRGAAMLTTKLIGLGERGLMSASGERRSEAAR